MLLFGGAAKFYDVILALLYQMVEHYDLELLESDPSTFINKYGAKIYEKSSIKVEKMKWKMKMKMKTKAADKMR